MEEAGDVGVDLKDKYDGKLFRRNTSNASEAWKNECQFADDVALLATAITWSRERYALMPSS